MMKFNVESIDQVRVDIDELLQAHHDEINMIGPIEVSPNWAVYKKLADSKVLHICTARDKETGELVGYYNSIVHRHMHYDILVAVCDTVFLKPAYRGLNSIMFFRFVENYLKQLDVDMMSFTIKPTVDFRGMAEHMGFELLEYVYFRRFK